jgi:hypothetical protein
MPASGHKRIFDPRRLTPAAPSTAEVGNGASYRVRSTARRSGDWPPRGLDEAVAMIARHHVDATVRLRGLEALCTGRRERSRSVTSVTSVSRDEGASLSGSGHPLHPLYPRPSPLGGPVTRYTCYSPRLSSPGGPVIRYTCYNPSPHRWEVY